ncbi:Pcl8p [Saccharomyces cerevisiae YJM1248]|nr:Pcl8p [Saccharomyces cerevisiae YJM195]AJW08203.1 Pcl8p [Saccharomyces cerevisiae YJM1439]AJW14147.1 Pcl8p [Saccharomyces cerevisiae YJM1248]
MANDQDPNKSLINDALTRSMSEFYDDDDDNDSDMCRANDEGEDVFDLPLKVGVSQSRNFSEVNDVLDPLSSLHGPSKKVRFEQQKQQQQHQQLHNDFNTDFNLKSPSSKKMGVEQLIQSANEINDYLANNIDKVNSFNSELLSGSGKLPGRVKSDTATQGTGRLDSMSNFALSDTELDNDDDNYLLDPLANASSTTPTVEHHGYSLLDKALSASDKEKIYTNKVNSNSQIDTDNHSHESGNTTNNETDENESSEILDYTKFDSFPYPPSSAPNGEPPDLKVLSIECEQENEKELRRISLLLDHYESIPKIPELSDDEALSKFRENIELILQLSKKINDNANTLAISSEDPQKFVNFVMKNPPSLSFRDFIDRIQNKCMFGAVVYLGATYLLQLVFLTRDEMDGPVKLKAKLQEDQAHRIIISTIRIATKLLEDFVHSQNYICKVFGISKRLLTKLEISFMASVNFDGLMITCEKLEKTLHILDDTRQALGNT